jgi:hypothetical protein
MRMDFYLGGYLLVEGQPRTPWMAPWLPPLIWSISSCICPSYPDSTGFSWASSEEQRAAEQARLRLDDDQMWGLLEECERVYASEATFGSPGIWRDLDAARAFFRRYLSTMPTLKLLGIVIPASHVDALMGSIARPTGLSLTLLQRQAPFLGGQPLGFEILGDKGAVSFYSFLCNSLEHDYCDRLGLTLNEHGLLGTYSDAERAAAYTNQEESGAEPVLWLPWLVLDYLL